MIRSTEFEETARALERLVSERRHESQTERLLNLIGDACRAVFGLPRHYHRENAIRERVVDLMTPYLAGELPPADRAWVDDLLAKEPICRQMAAPLIAAWSVPRGREELSAADVDAAWSRFQRVTAARQPGHGADA